MDGHLTAAMREMRQRLMGLESMQMARRSQQEMPLQRRDPALYMRLMAPPDEAAPMTRHAPFGVPQNLQMAPRHMPDAGSCRLLEDSRAISPASVPPKSPCSAGSEVQASGWLSSTSSIWKGC